MIRRKPNPIVISIILILALWLTDSIVDAIFFVEASVLDQLLHPEPEELWMRTLLAITILLFGVYIHYSRAKAVRGQEKWRLSQERLKLALEGSNDGLWDWNMVTGEIYRSPRWEEMLGYTPGTIAAHADAWTELVHGEDLDVANQHIEEHFAGHSEQYAIEYRMKSIAGDWLWILDRGKVVAWDESGNPTRSIGTHTLVHARKTAQESLKANEDKFRHILENSQPIIFMIDRNGKFILSAGKSLAALGLTPGQLEGQSALEMYKDYPDIFNGIKNGLAGRTSTFQTELQGSVFDTFFSPYHNAKGEVDGIIGMAVDITGLKNAESRLRLFRELIDRSNDVILVSDAAEGYFLDANRTACEILGYDREELLKLRVIDIEEEIPDDAAWRNHLAELRKYKYLISEGVHRRKDGSVFPIEVNTTIIELEDSEFVVAVVRDITERKASEEQLAHSAKLSALGQMAAGVAHEINNPLQNILMTTQILLSDPNLRERAQSDLQVIGKAAQQAGNIVRNILAFARKAPLKRQPCEIKDLITGCIEQLQLEGYLNDIEIVQELDENIGPVNIDVLQIQQVLVNLMKNAAQAMTGGGVLTLKTSTSQNNEELLLAIIDTGDGIPEEAVKKIFDPFYTTKGDGQGTGLGLALSDGLVDSHGGSIDVESEVGIGSTFTVRLPFADGSV